MATGREYFRRAESCLASVNEDSEASVALLLEAAVNGLLAIGAALGADLDLNDCGIRPIADLRLPDNDEAAAGCTATAPDMTPEGDQTP